MPTVNVRNPTSLSQQTFSPKQYCGIGLTKNELKEIENPSDIDAQDPEQ